jgi:hypothetical protein
VFTPFFFKNMKGCLCSNLLSGYARIDLWSNEAIMKCVFMGGADLAL